MPGGFCAICFGLSGLQTRVISPFGLKIFIISLVLAKFAVIMAMWSCNGAGKALAVVVIICVIHALNVVVIA